MHLIVIIVFINYTCYLQLILNCMPLVAIIFVVLAMRGVARDEALVRSLDRIR